MTNLIASVSIRDTPDIARDRFYLDLSVTDGTSKIILLSWLVFFLVGFIPAWLSGGGRAAVDSERASSYGAYSSGSRRLAHDFIMNSITHLWAINVTHWRRKLERYSDCASSPPAKVRTMIAMLIQRLCNDRAQWWKLSTIYLIISHGLAGCGFRQHRPSRIRAFRERVLRPLLGRPMQAGFQQNGAKLSKLRIAN